MHSEKIEEKIMIKISEAVFHPDPSVVSVDDFSKRVAQMRQSLCRIQQSSDAICVGTPDNLRIDGIGRKKSKRISMARVSPSSRIDHRK
jgi:hypothetical protein